MSTSKYFTPDIEDIRVGYEGWYFNSCMDELGVPELNYARWEKTILNKGQVETILKYGVREFKSAYLTKEQIESCGFTLKAKSIDSWFQINEDKRFDTDLQNFCGYKCYNVFLNYGFHDYRLKIKADFSGGADFDKAETLYDGECRCINQLKQILKQIHVTPFYEL